jgi:hypothetical protein
MLAVQLHCELVAEQAPAPKADLSRILGRPRKGFEPIERED